MKKQKQPIVKETHCLNCGTELNGAYCSKCGQKSGVHRDSFWHMVFHFAGDYFHYDSKFWTTLKTLFTKPGQITLDFIQGKRARYLNPLQLYIFVTTVMFVILFATFKPEIEHRTPASQSDSLHHINPVVQEGDTSFLIHNENVQIRRNGTMNMGYSNEDSTYEAYLLRQQSLLPSQRDNMLMKFFVKKIFELGDKYADTESLDELFLEKWLHNIPKVFFILLPWFALVLSWFFRKSGLFYVDHLIFSVHTHVVLFIVLTLRHLIDLIPIMQKVSDFYNLLAFGGILLYIVLSLRRVYGNGILKTVFKMVALNLLYLIGFFITSLIILFFTFFSL